MAMSPEHKEALARGRRESRAIKSYLEALASRKPGRPVTVESVKQKIGTLEDRISAEADPLKKVELVQARIDAEKQLDDVSNAADMDRLEEDFTEAVKPYSARKGISYSAWREAGVSAAVLKKAGVPRTRRT